jgi:hypothetical protein
MTRHGCVLKVLTAPDMTEVGSLARLQFDTPAAKAGFMEMYDKALLSGKTLVSTHE